MYAKAIAAFITPMIVSLLLPLGIDDTSSLAQVIEALIIAISTSAAVFFAKNKK